jgi:hypothetical protein
MFNNTTSTEFLTPKDSARGRISLGLSQARKEKGFSTFSELGILCAFARVIFFPSILQPLALTWGL